MADRIAKQKAFEDEIKEFEDQIRLEIDPSALPKAGSGVLKWPLSSIKITQYFGKTAFATANPTVYNGGGHNGVDFKAAIGTAVMASKEGVVAGVGNTDQSLYGGLLRQMGPHKTFQQPFHIVRPFVHYLRCPAVSRLKQASLSVIVGTQDTPPVLICIMEFLPAREWRLSPIRARFAAPI